MQWAYTVDLDNSHHNCIYNLNLIKLIGNAVFYKIIQTMVIILLNHFPIISAKII